MNPPISPRLLKCCDYISSGVRVADIGTDHGYLGIYLLQTQKASFIIASDINEMPLQSAKNNAIKYNVSGKMAFYLSDGVKNVPRDFDVMVCAGMGADTMIGILDNAPWLKSEDYRLILQCQSKRPELREYLYKNGFQILNEKLVRDGRFIYTVMNVQYRGTSEYTPGDCYISDSLKNNASALFPEFLQRVKKNLQLSVDGLRRKGTVEANKLLFYEEALRELSDMEADNIGNG